MTIKIALLSGAVKNAGDYLIVERSQCLLRHLLPQSEIKIFKRNSPLDSQIDEINMFDYIVFAGGPGYLPEMYPDQFPLVKDIGWLKPKMFALGMGGFGKNRKVLPIVFSDRSRLLMDRFVQDGLRLGCRDDLTERILKKSGYHDTIMTGCPAWYDLDYIDIAHVVNPVSVNEIKHIAISDPAYESSGDIAKKLVERICNTFKNARITFVYHRGRATNSDKFPKLAELQEWLRNQGIKIVLIPFSSEGLSIYDNCDLHIGFRVHAHIYSLSHRRASFLLEEDARGFGVNDSLGFKHFPSKGRFFLGDTITKTRCCIPSIRFPIYDHTVDSLLKYVVTEINANYPITEHAFGVMRNKYRNMKDHIAGLAKDVLSS